MKSWLLVKRIDIKILWLNLICSRCTDDLGRPLVGNIKRFVKGDLDGSIAGGEEIIVSFLQSLYYSGGAI
jgi:hypothetical protein